MTDFKNLKTTTEYAIAGFYDHIYEYIPDEYRLQYTKDESVITPREFYDQELTIENRLKYRATSIPMVERKSPWVAIMWNSEGLQQADNHFRLQDVKFKLDETWHRGKSCFVRLPMTMGIVSNSRTALDEFQEVFLLNIRPNDWTITAKHPLIENFTVNIMDFNFTSTTKLARTDGTLAMTMATVNIQYPIVGCTDNNTGIIKTINVYVRNMASKLLRNFTINDLN